MIPTKEIIHLMDRMSEAKTLEQLEDCCKWVNNNKKSIPEFYFNMIAHAVVYMKKK